MKIFKATGTKVREGTGVSGIGGATMRVMRWAVIALACGAALAGCANGPLVGVNGQLSFAPSSLDMGSIFPGRQTSQAVAIQNDGRASLTATWSGPGAPFLA